MVVGHDSTTKKERGRNLVGEGSSLVIIRLARYLVTVDIVVVSDLDGSASQWIEWLLLTKNLGFYKLSYVVLYN